MKHAGFDTLGTCTFPRGGGTGLRLRHRASGAQVVAVKNADPEMVFGIIFETLPDCANGVAHLLEHLVFRGSERYPQTNLYASLLQGSMLTGLNASTRADSTLFHLSSAEEGDFANLIDVVLDAVFHPLIRQSDFSEEQHVVMNEMTGHHAVPTNMVLERLRHELLPGSVYAVDHGGTPEMIAELRHADLRAFRAKNYHPGTARLFLWGDFDLAGRLDQLDRSLGSAGEADAFDLRMPSPFDRPRMASARYPAATTAPEMTAFGWAFEVEYSDLWRAVALGLLADADGPLRLALQARGGHVIGTGFSRETPLGTFEIALLGHPPMEQTVLSELIEETLHKVERNGSADDWTRRVADRLEYNLRSLGAQMIGPTGLRVLNMIRDEWRHGADPLALLDIDARVARLHDTINADPKAIMRRIREDLLDNPHRVTLSLRPQPTRKPRTPSRPYRPDPDPTLVDSISPVPFVATGGPPPRVRAIAVETEGNVLHLPDQAPDLSRAELAISLSGLTAGQIDMVPVLAMLLVDRPAEDGLDIWTRCWAAAGRSTSGEAFLSIAGRSLPAHGAHLPELLYGTLEAPLPPLDTVLRRITSGRDRIETQLAAMGHVFCETRLRAKGSVAGTLNERLVGFHRLDTLKRSLTLAPEELMGLLDTLRRTLAENGTMTLAVSGISSGDIKPFIMDRPRGAPAATLPLALDLAHRETIETGSANFSTGQAVTLGDAGPAHVAAHMLETGWLWDALRVAGGAYSVRCSYRSDDGLLSMLSVRDPNPERALEQFAKGPIWLRAAAEGNLLARCVSAKAGHLRRPIRPDDVVSTALQRHLCEQTDAMRQEELDCVFQVDAKAVTACADRFEEALREARTVVMGSRSGLPDFTDDDAEEIS